MTIDTLYLAALLGAIPAVAVARPSIGVDVGVNIGAGQPCTTAGQAPAPRPAEHAPPPRGGERSDHRDEHKGDHR